jgi:hypothetical protein
MSPTSPGLRTLESGHASTPTHHSLEEKLSPSGCENIPSRRCYPGSESGTRGWLRDICSEGAHHFFPFRNVNPNVLFQWAADRVMQLQTKNQASFSLRPGQRHALLYVHAHTLTKDGVSQSFAPLPTLLIALFVSDPTCHATTVLCSSTRDEAQLRSPTLNPTQDNSRLSSLFTLTAPLLPL